MPIDYFSREEFEAALPRDKVDQAPLWAYSGIVAGEHQYTIPVLSRHSGHGDLVIATIHIRSSVMADGESAGKGQNSIRVWLKDSKDQIMAPKQKYITRVPGWSGRLETMLRNLYRLALQAGICPKCHSTRHIVKGKDGRVWALCPNRCRTGKRLEG